MLYYKTKTLLIFSATVLEKDQGMKIRFKEREHELRKEIALVM